MREDPKLGKRERVGRSLRISNTSNKLNSPAPIRLCLTVREELSLGSDGVSEDAMLFQPIDVEVDEAGNIYVLDLRAVHIKVFDRQGAFLRTIGTKGQGPGEFQRPSDIALSADGELVVCDSGARRILSFTPEGRFSETLSTGKMLAFNQIAVDTQRNIIGSYVVMEEKARAEVVKFDPQLEPLSTIASVQIARYPEINPYMPRLFFEVAGGDLIVWGMTTEYDLRVAGPDGKLVMRIVKDHDPVKLTQADRDARSDEMWGSPPPPR